MSEQSIEKILKDIEKQYGTVLIDGLSLLDKEQTIISVSPSIDLALGGGIPSGTFVTFTSPPKFGKTNLALSFSANCQLPKYGSRDIFLIDSESRLKPRDLQIQGLDPSKLTIIKSSPGNILSAQQFLGIVENIIK